MISDYILKKLIREETKNMLIYMDKKCKVCGKQAEVIHHKLYRWKPKIEDIEFLCKKCHSKLKKSKLKIIMEDEINYNPLSELTNNDLEFLEKIKSLNKKSFIIADIKKVDNRNPSSIIRNLKKLEVLNIIKRGDMVSPLAYEFIESNITEGIKSNHIVENVYSIIKEKATFTNVDCIRKEYKKRFMRNISWNTIRHYLEVLKEENKIMENVITVGKTKISSVIKVV